MATGVDRVERAWLNACLADPRPVLGLLRTPVGFALLDRAGMQRFARAFDHDDWGRAGPVAMLFRRLDPARRAAQGRVRALAVARVSRRGLTGMLRRWLPPGAVYFNTGHANLDNRVMRALHGAGARVVVLLHDTIPLDLPQAAPMLPRSLPVMACLALWPRAWRRVMDPRVAKWRAAERKGLAAEAAE